MKNIFLIILIILSNTLICQSLKQKQADKRYNTLAYTSAIELYSDLVKGENPTEDNLRKIAFCYYQTYDFINSQKYYKILLQKYTSNFKEEDAINYFQVLKYNESYEEVKSSLAILGNLKEESLILKSNRSYSDHLKAIKNDSASYKIYPVKGVNTSNSEFSPVFFKKNDYMMFASNRRNTSVKNKTFAWDNSYFIDMYTVSKQDTITFNETTQMSKDITSIYHDGPCCLSEDEKTIYITRTNYLNKKLQKSEKKVVNLKLFILKKDDKGQLGVAESFPFNSDEYSIGHPAITKSGQRLYFVSDMPGGYGQTDIWYSDLVNNAWQKPINLGPAINTEGREMFPYIFDNGTMFFSSDGKIGLGGLDIFFAVPELDLYFEPQSLGYPINTHYDDFGFALNKDLKTGYFSSNREGGKGNDDIYFFRSKEPIIGSSISGVIFEDSSKELLTNAWVYLLDNNKLVIDSIKVNSRAEYQFKIEDPSKVYYVGAKERSKYYDRLEMVKEILSGDNKKDIGLFPKYKTTCTVKDAKTNSLVEGVKIKFMDKKTYTIKTYTTNLEGAFTDVIRNKKINDTLQFVIRYEKEGYITVEKLYNMILGVNTIIDLHESVQKLEIGTDIAKVIQINPIYFDLAKWDIRADAAKELDKIVKVMQENETMIIELGSHTDCRSSKSYNLLLSDRRAKSSAAYIVSKGIAKKRIIGKGYGENKLINQCACEGKNVVFCSELEHQENRRTEFIIIKY